MPMSWSSRHTPGGCRYLRTVASGPVTDADARSLTDVIAAGRPHHLDSVLAIVEPATDFSPEARQAFMGMGPVKIEKHVYVAVVVHSAPLRVLLSFVIRMSGAVSSTRFFESEAAAARWLHASLDT